MRDNICLSGHGIFCVRFFDFKKRKELHENQKIQSHTGGCGL